MQRYEQGLYRFVETRYGQLMASLAEKKAIDDGMKEEILAALREYAKEFAAVKA